MLDEKLTKLIECHIMAEDIAPYPHYTGMALGELDEGRAVLTLTVTHKDTNGYRIAHGGCLMTLADSAMGAACFTYRKQVVTLSASISYIKSVPEGEHIRAIAHVVHNGSRTLSVDCDIVNSAGDICAQARGTFFVVGHLDGDYFVYKK